MTLRREEPQVSEGKRTSRLRLIKHGLLATVGAAGAGVAAREGHAARPKNSRLNLTVHGRGWHASVPGKRRGQLPDRGQAFNVHGELVDRRGKAVGEFVASAVQIDSPFAGSALGLVSFEHHVLHLGDGAIFATGHSSAGEGAFAVVGGTGRYAGATGSYSASQSVHGLGGDGTAKLTIDVTIA